MSRKTRIWVCHSADLKEADYHRVDVLYSQKPSSVIVFRHNGECLAYRNLCVHMPRELDCEADMIFDATGRLLRCSMHGIVYEPKTGTSVSEICWGKKLTPVKVEEADDGIWISDKRVRPMDEEG